MAKEVENPIPQQGRVKARNIDKPKAPTRDRKSTGKAEVSPWTGPAAKKLQKMAGK